MVAGTIAGDIHESFGRCPCRGAVAVTAVRGGDMGGVLAGCGSAAIAAAS